MMFSGNISGMLERGVIALERMAKALERLAILLSKEIEGR